MQIYLDFFARHLQLSSAFVILLMAYLMLELRLKLTGPMALTSSAAILLHNRDQAIFLDVRDAVQFAQGHIIDALNIPAEQLTKHFAQLDKHKTKTIVLVNAAGMTLTKISNTLQQQGYTSIKILSGGIAAWTNANLPLVKD